uniref:Uncharacterized protein n=1 Tax=Romanomermis culicivorax TaxID=13658 RepID=A0A915KXP2_ROMCU
SFLTQKLAFPNGLARKSLCFAKEAIIRHCHYSPFLITTEARSSDWRKEIDGCKTFRNIEEVATGAVFKEKQSMI